MRKHLILPIILFATTTVAFGQPQFDAAGYYDGKSNGEIIAEIIDYWENFYQQEYFSKGTKKTEMSGTGYYPYMRWRWFIEKRMDQEGEIPYLGRWQAYESSKLKQMEPNRATATADWVSLGPSNRGGRMLSHAFHPDNSQIIFAGSASGGLWKTTNGGDSWSPLTDQLPSLAVSAFVINPQNPQVMLMGTGEGFNNIDAVRGVGILKTTDGGITWSQTGFAYQQLQGISCFSMVWDHVDTNLVYVGATNGTWKSTDAGETWTKVKAGRGTSIVIDRQSPNILYLAVSGSGLFKSTDHGDSWVKMLIGAPLTPGFTSLAICDSFPNYIYAGAATGAGDMEGFYKTTNGGDSWTLLTTPDFYCHAPPNNNICQGWYDNVTGVSPVDTNTVFANGVNLFRSTDGGSNWTNPAGVWPGTNIHVDHHSFGFDPQGPNTVYAFNDGGVFKSTDGGDTWAEKNEGLVTFQFYALASAFTDTNIVTGGSQDNGTRLVDNSGGNTNWTQWIGADGMVCNIDYTNKNIMYGEIQFGSHRKTTNGGASSFQINNGINEDGPWVTPVAMDPIDPSILYTISDIKIYKTVNGGNNWTQVGNLSADFSNNAIAIDQVNTDVVYISTGSVVRKTTDGGVTWGAITSPGPNISDLEADPHVEGVVYATRSLYNPGNQVWKSVDFGQTWQNISGNFPGIPANAIAINSFNSNHLYVGSDLGVYLSIDGGSTWQEFNDNLPNVFIDDIHFHPVDYTVRVGTHGRGYWKSKAADSNLVVSIAQGEPKIPTGFNLYQNYPNPFNPSTTIEFNLQNDAIVSIRVFNSLGQEVAKLFEGSKSPGRHTIRWDGQNRNGMTVSSGTYFIRLEANGVAKHAKVLFLK